MVPPVTGSLICARGCENGRLGRDAEPAERVERRKMTRWRRFQHGSLFKRGKRSKVWVGRYYEPEFRTGGACQTVRRSVIVGTVADLPTRRDAENAFANFVRRVNTKDVCGQLTCTFGEFAGRSWLPEVLPTLKYSTKKYYEYVLKTHLLPALGDMQLRLISRETVRSLVTAKLQDGLSWKTVKHLRTVLGTVLKAAELEGLIDSNPVPKTRFARQGPTPERPAIDPQQVRELVDALPEPSRSLALIIALTALRIGEVLALRWSDVDLDERVLQVKRTVYDGHFDEPKTKGSKRTIPLSPAVIAILRSRKRNEDANALVFSTRSGAPLSPRNLRTRQLKPTARLLGMPEANWHWLRHASATLFDSVGTPIGTTQKILGHSSSEITRGVYVHSVPADAQVAVAKVEDLLNGPKRTQVFGTAKLGSLLIQ